MSQESRHVSRSAPEAVRTTTAGTTAGTAPTAQEIVFDHVVKTYPNSPPPRSTTCR